LQPKDNFDEINPKTLREIINGVVSGIKEGKIYKGKSG